MSNINIYLFGLGNVGSTFIEQVLEAQSYFKIKHDIDLKIVGLANSSQVLTQSTGITQDWKNVFNSNARKRTPHAFYDFSQAYPAINVAVDATASAELSLFYPELFTHHFHVVTANKIANTLSQSYYDNLRDVAARSNVQFKYETNVGAGLPIVETVQCLVSSNEKITAINGVFSGSLGYIFDQFSQTDGSFSDIVLDALDNGFTEPDPREDLSGKDVARKLLVLARETGWNLELEDVAIHNLVPVSLLSLSKSNFLPRISELNDESRQWKSDLKPNEVLRHLGKIDFTNKTLEVKLQAVDKNSVLGQLAGSDGYFEIFTQSYKKRPLIIQGAGAGREVTARGLLSDVIKVVENASQLVQEFNYN